MDKDIKEIIAERLRDLREEKGFSYKRLEKETDISSSALCRIENCKVDVRGYQIYILASYFWSNSRLFNRFRKLKWKKM